MIGFLLNKLLPQSVLTSLQAYRILSRDYGHYRSVRQGNSVDKDGQPIPWFSYPIIEYLKQLNLSQKTVFEFGSGNSTRFWAARCQHVTSVEDNPVWYRRIQPLLPTNVNYILADTEAAYISAIEQTGKRFDLIVVDGSHRFKCVQVARKYLADTGMLILDNADWFPKTTAYLRSTDLIEIDMAGFNPINGYITTTSLFLTRQMTIEPISTSQPNGIIGGITHEID